MEVYSVDICSKSNLIVYGTSKDFAEVYNFLNDQPVLRAQDFNDSVIFVKMIDPERYIFASFRLIVLTINKRENECMEDELPRNEAENEHVTIEDDISIVEYDNNLLVGTNSGHVYMYDRDLVHINTYHAHYDEIIQLCFNGNGDVMSLDAHKFTCSDRHGRLLYHQDVRGATSMCYVAGDVYCVASSEKIQVFQREKRLFSMKIDEEVNGMVCLGKDIVIGGDFQYILLVNTNGFGTYRLETDDTVVKIVKLSNTSVVFSTASQSIGMLDIRDIKSLKYYNPGIGHIFDIKTSDDKIIAGGEKGICVLSKDGNEYLCENTLLNNYCEIEENTPLDKYCEIEENKDENEE